MPSQPHSRTHTPIDFEKERAWRWNRPSMRISRIRVILDAGQGRSAKRALTAPVITYMPEPPGTYPNGYSYADVPTRLTMQYSKMDGRLVIRAVPVFAETPRLDDPEYALLDLALSEWHTVLFSYRPQRATYEPSRISLTKARFLTWRNQ